MPGPWNKLHTFSTFNRYLMNRSIMGIIPLNDKSNLQCNSWWWVLVLFKEKMNFSMCSTSKDFIWLKERDSNIKEHELWIEKEDKLWLFQCFVQSKVVRKTWSISYIKRLTWEENENAHMFPNVQMDKCKAFSNDSSWK